MTKEAMSIKGEQDQGNEANPSLPDRASSESQSTGLLPRPITDADLVDEADRNYDLGRRHGKGEMLDAQEWLVKVLHEYRAQHDLLWRTSEVGRTSECPCGRCIHGRAAIAAIENNPPDEGKHDEGK